VTSTTVRKLVVLGVGCFTVLAFSMALLGSFGRGVAALGFLFAGGTLAYAALRMP
jgi:hypothetical protein